MKRMTFASSVSSHMYDGLHLFEQMCHLCLVGTQRCSINEEDDFCLIGTTPVFIFLNSFVAFTSSVPSNDVSNPTVRGRDGGVVTQSHKYLAKNLSSLVGTRRRMINIAMP
jgi:hypothetical protein